MTVHTVTPLAAPEIAHQRRVREIVKRLVIELGYLEYCTQQNQCHNLIEGAATCLDTAIDDLNEYLSTL